MPVDIRLVPCLSDNYAVVLRDAGSGTVIVVDAPEAPPIVAALDREGWKPTHILITHRHEDHVAGVPALKARYGATVLAPPEAEHIGIVDTVVNDGETLRLGPLTAEVIATPGHTDGHVSFWFPEEALLFAGDTMFVLGCGRVLEGSPATLWDSLKTLRALPPETTVFVGHEYTQSNARFARTVDPSNRRLAERAEEIDAARAAGRPTVPTTLAEERATNPFLRADVPDVAAAVGMAGRDPAEVFTELRERKNRG